LEASVLVPVLSVLCTVLSLIVGFLTFNRNRDKDVKNDASESAVIKTKLDTISSGIDSIRIDIKANEKRVSELSERLIRNEESVKSAHKRIDKIEDKGGNGE
jgi:septal ring factor EnvC (AmiA/AmiB activator)